MKASYWITTISAICLLSIPVLAQKNAGPRETTEIFRVGNVGRGGVAETRETLKVLYTQVAKDYDVELAKAVEEQKAAFRGKQVRILKILDETDANGQLYLCAYGGKPSVFSIAGPKYKGGSKTPALTIAEDGTHSTKITRTVMVQAQKTKDNQPALEKVSSGGGVTFFGIPIGGAASSEPEPEPEAAAPQPKRKQVTETKTLAKFKASVSTEKLEGGPERMSTAMFVDLLKNGDVYSVEQKENRRCQECRGFGRITTTQPVGLRDPDGKMPCPPCAAVGKIDWQVTYKVAW